MTRGLVLWIRWMIRLIALGLLTIAVAFAVIAPDVAHQGQSFTCSLSPWAQWRHGYQLGSLGIFSGVQAMVSQCTSTADNSWHVAWILGTAALMLLVGSFLLGHARFRRKDLKPLTDGEQKAVL